MAPVAVSPREAAASRRLGNLLSSDLPELAVQWLMDGHDTPSLRELAGESPRNVRDIDREWTAVRRELRLPVLTDQQAVEIAVLALLDRRHRDALSVETVLSRIHTWATRGTVPGLDVLYQMEDELEISSGTARDIVVAEINRTLDMIGRSLRNSASHSPLTGESAGTS